MEAMKAAEHTSLDMTLLCTLCRDAPDRGRQMGNGCISPPTQLEPTTSGGSVSLMASPSRSLRGRRKKKASQSRRMAVRLITAVSLENASLWVHDLSGEHQISLEGRMYVERPWPERLTGYSEVIRRVWPPSRGGREVGFPET